MTTTAFERGYIDAKKYWENTSNKQFCTNPFPINGLNFGNNYHEWNAGFVEGSKTDKEITQ